MSVVLLLVLLASCYGVVGGEAAPDPLVDDDLETLSTTSKCDGGSRLSSGYCTPSCPCGVGDGDCDSDDECHRDLHCRANVGASYGGPPWVDVCEVPVR